MPWWMGRFRGCGHRITVPRQMILQVLSKASGHLSAEDIYLQVHKAYPSIGLATVYRTLDLLTRMGVVSKFDFGDGRARYEIAHPHRGKQHHHLICTNCWRVMDYTDFIGEEMDLLNRTEKWLSDKYAFKITHHSIHFYGLCEKCQSKGFGKREDGRRKNS
ncbi:MAG: Fur family transcriptional regulator [bacterium]